MTRWYIAYIPTLRLIQLYYARMRLYESNSIEWEDISKLPFLHLEQE